MAINSEQLIKCGGELPMIIGVPIDLPQIL
jgi:hypothetical protein